MLQCFSNSSELQAHVDSGKALAKTVLEPNSVQASHYKTTNVSLMSCADEKTEDTNVCPHCKTIFTEHASLSRYLEKRSNQQFSAQVCFLHQKLTKQTPVHDTFLATVSPFQNSISTEMQNIVAKLKCITCPNVKFCSKKNCERT
jgi:hypothetical protein